MIFSGLRQEADKAFDVLVRQTALGCQNPLHNCKVVEPKNPELWCGPCFAKDVLNGKIDW
jgi:hypothetical protein